MTQRRKNSICALLKGIETADSSSVLVVNPNKYIQSRKGPNLSGPSIVDGKARATELHKTEGNRQLVREFLETVLYTEQLSNYVRAACEGKHCGVHSAFYDLYCISEGKIAVHWDTVETIPPRSEWKNQNSNF